MALYTGALDPRSRRVRRGVRANDESMTSSSRDEGDARSACELDARHGRGDGATRACRSSTTCSSTFARYAGLDLDARRRAATCRTTSSRTWRSRSARRVAGAAAGDGRALRRSHRPHGRRAGALRARPRRPALLPRPAAEHAVRPLDALVQRQRAGDAAPARAARPRPPPHRRGAFKALGLALRDALVGLGRGVQHQGRASRSVSRRSRCSRAG